MSGLQRLFHVIALVGALLCMAGAPAVMLSYVGDKTPTMIRVGGLGLMALVGGAAVYLLARLLEGRLRQK